MKLFFIKNNILVPQIKPEQQLSQLRAVLSISPQSRTNQQHNLIYNYFKQNIFFRNIDKNKGTIKMMLAMSLVATISLDRNQKQTIELLKQKRFMYILHGRIVLRKQKEKKIVSTGTTLVKQQLLQWSDIIIKDVCQLAVITQFDYSKVISFNQKLQIRSIVDLFKKFQLINTLDYIDLIYLASKTNRQKYVSRQIIYKQNQQPEFWYGIIKGQFQYMKKESKSLNQYRALQKSQKLKVNTKSGKNIQITILQQNQTFGEQQIILNTKRQYSISCISNENEVLKISGKDLLQVMQKYPKILQKWKRNTLMKKNIKNELQRSIEFLKSNYNESQRDRGYNKYYNTINNYTNRSIENKDIYDIKTELGPNNDLLKNQKEQTINGNTLNKSINRGTETRKKLENYNISNFSKLNSIGYQIQTIKYNNLEKKKTKITQYQFIKQSSQQNKLHFNTLTNNNQTLKLPNLINYQQQKSNFILPNSLTTIGPQHYIKEKQNILNKILRKNEHISGIIPIQLQRRQLIKISRPQQKSKYERKLTTSKQYIQQFLHGIFKGIEVRILPKERDISNKRNSGRLQDNRQFQSQKIKQKMQYNDV